MTMRAIVAMLLVVTGTCYGDQAVAPVQEPRKSPETELVVSTNDLARILLGATNCPGAPAARRLYADHAISLNPHGNLRARFDLVSIFSTQYELLSKLAECLVASPVKVRRQPDGSYSFLSQTGQKYLIQIIHDECDSLHFQGVYYITGQRLLVRLEALLHLESRPNARGGIEYGAKIYAGTDSRLVNLSARMPFVRDILNGEVNSVVSKFDPVYAELLTDPQDHLRRLMQLRDPAAELHFTDEELALVRQFVDRLPANPTTDTGK